MLILVPVSAVLRLSGNGKIMKDLPAWEAAQSVMILLLALTGAYLYVFRLVNRKKRQRRAATVANHAPAESR
jgi:hypothetical protein